MNNKLDSVGLCGLTVFSGTDGEGAVEPEEEEVNGFVAPAFMYNLRSYLLRMNCSSAL